MTSTLLQFHYVLPSGDVDRHECSSGGVRSYELPFGFAVLNDFSATLFLIG